MTGAKTTRSRLTRAFAIGALATLALAGCGGNGDSDSDIDGESGGGEVDGTSSVVSLDLDGKTFTATETSGWVIVTGSTIQLTFDDGRVSAQAGCNTLSGDATWSDERLVLEGPLASTAMACARGLEAQDQWLTKLLESDPRLAVDSGSLIIGTDRNGMTMTEGG